MTSIRQFDDAAINDSLRGKIHNRGRQPGVQERLTGFVFRALRRLAQFRAYRLLTLEPGDVPASFSSERHALEGRAVCGDELATLAGKHKDVSAEFIARTAPKGDWCYAYFDGDKLASYGWYSYQPTRVGEEFDFEFPNQYAYMYRGFTERDYRGARLHGHGMVQAVHRVANEGRRGLIGLVEAQNAASLRSVQRIGYRRQGTIIMFRFFGRWKTFRTPKCRRFGCRLVRRRETVKC